MWILSDIELGAGPNFFHHSITSSSICFMCFRCLFSSGCSICCIGHTHKFQVYVLNISSVSDICCKCFISMLHTLQCLYTYVASVCFKCFICLKRMLQVFYLVPLACSSTSVQHRSEVSGAATYEGTGRAAWKRGEARSRRHGRVCIRAAPCGGGQAGAQLQPHAGQARQAAAGTCSM
jgi:hypothetical protein